jgi:hypothetical protein
MMPTTKAQATQATIASSQNVSLYLALSRTQINIIFVNFTLVIKKHQQEYLPHNGISGMVSRISPFLLLIM